MNEKTTAGIHKNAIENIELMFNPKEQSIVKIWSSDWFVTTADRITISTSEYRYFTVKATFANEEALSVSREIIVLISLYQNFEPRTLGVFEYINRRYENNRIEQICCVLISADSKIEENLRACLTNKESQIIVPFSIEELSINKSDQNYIRNQFRRHFYSRDLFDFSDPLKKDFYFFGRSNLTIEIIEKHKSNQLSGLFGLRKTGKTSIIYDVVRKAPQRDAVGILIDCENTSFNFRRWNEALYYVILRVYQELGIPDDDIMEDQFSVTNSALLFEKYIRYAANTVKKSLLILFDEIENISFGKASVSHWCTGLDFVYFWQSIRSTYQHTENVFTFCILGTNPLCVEVPTILGKDNPIFNAFQPKYIPGFDQSQTREMVRKLGRLMGLVFDEGVYTRLSEDYGGHPFLIRQLCSRIAQEYNLRPVNIDRLKYTTARDTFNQSTDYFEMLLEVLIQFYPDEYEMLKLLALKDIETFKYYANEDYSMVKHLIGYGIIRKIDEDYDFCIDSIKDYIIRKDKKRILVQSDAEKWAEVCTSRNELEVQLRKMVKTILRISLKNEANAKDAIIKKIYGADAARYSSYTYDDLFDSRKSNIFLNSIGTLINSNWDCFSSFWDNQDIFQTSMKMLNKEGRFDAHATVPEDHEMIIIRAAIDKIQIGIDRFKVNILM